MTTTQTIQIAFDTTDPHAVATFWAAALGYQKEDNSGLVKQLIDGGQLPVEATVETEYGREFADVTACVDPDGRRPRLFFQRVPEKKSVKNRLHLDVRPPDSMDEEVERALALGATIDRRVDVEGSFWTIMFDPEGNEFCILRGPEDGWSRPSL